MVLGDLPAELIEDRREKDSGSFFAQRDRLVRSFERAYLSDFLTRHGGDVAAAAEDAEVPRGTFYRLMKTYGLRSSTGGKD